MPIFDWVFLLLLLLLLFLSYKNYLYILERKLLLAYDYHLIFIISLKALSPNAVKLEVGA